jgi:ribosomal-protein-alanine N-acetyltransferase
VKVLETERLILRHLSPEQDAEFMLELLNEPAFIKNIADRGVRSTEDARQYLASGPLASYEQNGFGMYAVELKESGVPVGVCGLVKREGLDDVDIGYAFLERFWSNGYAYESASAVLDYGRDVLGLERIVAITTPDNQGSIRVLEKIGLRFEKLITLPGYEGESRLFGLPSQP